MGFFNRGDEPIKEVSSGQFWRPDPKAPLNRVFILPPDLQKILVAPKHGVFKVSGGPCNASWIDIGAQDVGNLLGLKAAQKAFIWVLVPNDPTNKSKGYETRMWECSKTQFQGVVTAVQEFGLELQGLMVVLKKDGNRWSISANKAPKAHEVPAETLAEAWGAVVEKHLDGSDEEAIGKVVGLIPTQALQKKFLIERIQKEDASVVNWNQVLRKFGFEGQDSQDDEDVVEM